MFIVVASVIYIAEWQVASRTRDSVSVFDVSVDETTPIGTATRRYSLTPVWIKAQTTTGSRTALQTSLPEREAASPRPPANHPTRMTGTRLNYISLLITMLMPFVGIIYGLQRKLLLHFWWITFWSSLCSKTKPVWRRAWGEEESACSSQRRLRLWSLPQKLWNGPQSWAATTSTHWTSGHRPPGQRRQTPRSHARSPYGSKRRNAGHVAQSRTEGWRAWMEEWRRDKLQ